jgi:hypothetical protein
MWLNLAGVIVSLTGIFVTITGGIVDNEDKQALGTLYMVWGMLFFIWQEIASQKKQKT